MKKTIVILVFLCCVASLMAVEPTPIDKDTVSAESVVTDTVGIKLDYSSSENQYVWVGFTSKAVTSQSEDPSTKLIPDGTNIELSMNSGDTATNEASAGDENKNLYISAQFAYKGRVKVTLSGSRMQNEGKTEYLGYTVSDMNKASEYLNVTADDDVAVSGLTPVITHNGSSNWMSFDSEQLLIETTSLSGKTSTSFTGSIKATIESDGN